MNVHYLCGGIAIVIHFVDLLVAAIDPSCKIVEYVGLYIRNYYIINICILQD